MTRVYDNPTLAGQPVTRAFVVGVGAYPQAKEANAVATTPQPLRNVSDLPSAATGAALFCDWLITNGAQLTPPLASVDLLINIEAGGKHYSAYSWTNRIVPPAGGLDPRIDTSVDAPDTTPVRLAGTAWMADLQQGANNQAIFYICGHGTVLGPDSLVFLSDLNAFPGNPWGALINVSNHARAFTQMASLSSAVFLVDACGELLVDLLKVNPGVGAQFAFNDPQNVGEEKVTVLAAAAPGRLTYDGALPDAPGVRAGRFTQCLIQGLNGAAVRDITGQGDWSIHPQGLFQDLKALYRLRDDWGDRRFDPTPPIMPADEFPILRFAQAPEVPVRVRLTPPQGDQWTFAIHDQQNAVLRSRDLSAPADWLTSVPASLTPHTFVGDRPPNGPVGGAAAQAAVQSDQRPLRSEYGVPMKGFTFIPPAGTGAARLRVVAPNGRSTDFFTTPGDSGVEVEADGGSYTAFVEPLGQRPRVFHFDVSDTAGMEIIEADKLAAASDPEFRTSPDETSFAERPAPPDGPRPRVPSAFAVMSQASFDPLFFLGADERPPPTESYFEVPSRPPPVARRQSVRLAIGLSNDGKPFDPGGWIPYDGPPPRIEQDDRGVSLTFADGKAMGSPVHSRVRVAIAVEDGWVERLLAPLFTDGVRIGLSVAPGGEDIDLSVTPLDPQRLALAQALDAGGYGRGQRRSLTRSPAVRRSTATSSTTWPPTRGLRRWRPWSRSASGRLRRRNATAGRMNSLNATAGSPTP